MRLLITGSSGRLGSALVYALQHEHEIVQFDIRPPFSLQQWSIGDLFIGSFTDPTLVAKAMEGVECVIHCGAIPSNFPPFDRLITVNVSGTVTLLEAAGCHSTVKQFIFISTIRVHGVLEEPTEEFFPRFLPFNEDHPYLTVEYYGTGKLHAEQWCRSFVRRYKKPLIIFRPTFIVPTEHEATFPSRPPKERPSLYDYVAVSDCVDAIKRSLTYEPPLGYEVFLLHAPDQFCTIPSVELAKRYFPNVPRDEEKLNRCNGFGAFVDCTKAIEHLGWRPKITCKRS